MLRYATRFAVVLLVLPAATVTAAWGQSDIRSDRFTTSDGAELHYLEAGSGSVLVFVPGWTIPAEIWEPQLRHFASSHRVVALDPRSQGRSQKVTDGHYLSRRGQDIGELLEHLGAEPAVVVGWSLSVLELLTYAQEFGTDALRAAVLVDMFIGTDLEPGEPHPLAAPWLTPFQMDRQAFTRAFVRGMYRTELTDQYLDAMTEAVLATPTNTAVTLITNTYPLGPGDWRPALDALDRPVLLATRSPRQSQMVRARRPDASIEVFEEAGHALFVDEADRFNRLLGEFLADLPER